MKTKTGRRQLVVGLAFLLVCALILPDVSFAQDKKPLRKKTVQQVVKQMIPAIKLHDQTAFLNTCMPLFKSLKPNQIEEVDELCREHGATPATEWFTELVLSNHHQGIDLSRVTSSTGMAAVTLDGVIQRINEFEGLTAEHSIMQEPLEVPSDFLESEQLFWSLHVLHNEFDNISRDLQFARALAKKHRQKLLRRAEDKNYPEQLDAIEERVKQQYKTIKERVADLRLQRFKSAHQALAEPSNKDDFELMLTSAMALEQDGQVLNNFLTGNDAINRASLAVPELLAQIKEMMTSGKKSAGDVAVKANSFRNGLHYWVRGRFGAGPLANGLVKSPNSTRSVESMKALIMPKVRDKPISNFLPEEESIAGYDRRHYKTWAAEYRPAKVVRGRTDYGSSSQVTRSSSNLQESTFL